MRKPKSENDDEDNSTSESLPGDEQAVTENSAREGGGAGEDV